MAYVGPVSKYVTTQHSAWNRYSGVYYYYSGTWVNVDYPLLTSHYEYLVNDCAVLAKLTESYKAKSKVDQEISYLFEVPPEASVFAFTAQVGDTVIKAIVDEKAQANEKYQQAKSAGVQAWKIDKVDGERFQITLGNAKPDSLITVK